MCGGFSGSRGLPTGSFSEISANFRSACRASRGFPDRLRGATGGLWGVSGGSRRHQERFKGPGNIRGFQEVSVANEGARGVPKGCRGTSGDLRGSHGVSLGCEGVSEAFQGVSGALQGIFGALQEDFRLQGTWGILGRFRGSQGVSGVFQRVSLVL